LVEDVLGLPRHPPGLRASWYLDLGDLGEPAVHIEALVLRGGGLQAGLQPFSIRLL
jgi:hypothetical protein